VCVCCEMLDAVGLMSVCLCGGMVGDGSYRLDRLCSDGWTACVEARTIFLLDARCWLDAVHGRANRGGNVPIVQAVMCGHWNSCRLVCRPVRTNCIVMCAWLNQSWCHKLIDIRLVVDSNPHTTHNTMANQEKAALSTISPVNTCTARPGVPTNCIPARNTKYPRPHRLNI